LGIPLPASVAADCALLFTYLGLWRSSTEYDTLVSAYLDQATTHSSAGPTSAALLGGTAGIGWTIRHVAALLGAPADDVLSDLDQHLVDSLRRDNWGGNFDLVGGLVGLGVYFSESGDSNAREALGLIVDQLAVEAEVGPDGLVFWRSRLLPDGSVLQPHEVRTKGSLNLGVAHGIPGVIGFLSIAAAMGIRAPKATTLLAGSLRWLKMARRPLGSPTAFAHFLDPGFADANSRSAWCYGDLGIAGVLLQVGIEQRSDDVFELARSTLDACLGRPLAIAGVRDSGVCHGALGCAHIFARAFFATGIERYAEEARQWAKRVSGLLVPGRGIAGYAMSRAERKAHLERGDVDFLTGAVGCALVLLSLATPTRPEWDRLLLLSPPLPSGDPA